MSNTYLKFLSRNKLYTLIEFFSLSVALSFVILLASYARTEYSVGARQPLSKELYIVGAGSFAGMTIGTADEFFPSIPEISEWTRIADAKANVRLGEDYYQVQGCYIDTNFFQLFDYRLRGCSPEKVLENQDEVLLSERFAAKLFGAENPIGRSIEVGNSQKTVAGVVEDFGPCDLFTHFDLFCSIKIFEKKVQWMDNFGSSIPIARLRKDADVDQVRERLLQKYADYWDFYAKDNTGNDFIWGASLTRFDQFYFSGLDAWAGGLRSGDRKQVEVLFAVALVLLISAIFNYINLTVAQTGKRAKEMATRRLLGESRRSIVGRYLAESTVFTIVCFALGCALAVLLCPFFERILSTDIVLTPDWTTALLALLAVLLIAAISALLPAIQVARFKPVDVVKGEFRLKSKLVFSKVFITLQGVLSTFLLAMAITMTAQVQYLVNRPMGYNTHDIIQVNSYALGYTRGPQENLSNRLKMLPCVEAAGLALSSPLNCGANGLHDGNDELIGWLRMAQLDTASLSILGFKPIEQYSTLSARKVLLTSTSKAKLGASAEHPFVGGSESAGEVEVCGIVPDFNVHNALFKPEVNEYNCIMVIDGDYPYASSQLLKIKGDRKAAMAAVKEICQEFARESIGMPVEMQTFYLDEQLTKDLSGTKNTMLLVLTFMVMSILISAMGLFAMSLYFTQQQKRQIALRKVYGAGVSSAVWTLTRSFMLISACSIILAAPLTVWGINFYLSDFYTRIAFPWWAIAVAALLSLGISLLSVIAQSHHAATRNPVKTLAQE